MSPVSFLLALPTGTTAPAVAWSSGSMRERALYGKLADVVIFFSNCKMKIKTEMPGFDVLQL
jgi:hypothetical protein